MKKRLLSFVFAVVLLCTMPPNISLEVNAHYVETTASVHSVVMTADEFIGYLQYVVDREDSEYGSGDQYSIGKYQKNKYGEYRIYFDCWGLGESIICTKGEIVYNRNESLNPWNLWDTSCGCGSYSGDYLKTQCQLSSDFTNIVPGEWLFRDDASGHCYHVGYYIGNGKVIESTSDGSYNTQITTIDSNGHSDIRGSSWTWTSHGKVPWLEYCSHSYKDCGVCSKCGYVYDWESTLSTEGIGRYKTLRSFTPRTDKPYEAATPASSKIAAGVTVDVVGIYTNAYKTNGQNNVWYKFQTGGKTYFGYSGDFQFVEYFDQGITCTITSPAEGATVPKAAYPVIGTVTSKYPLQEVKAYIDGTCYAAVTLGSATSLDVRSSAINQLLDFAALSPGRHTLRIDARDIHHSNMVTVCTRTFTTEGTASHTCDRGTYMYFEAVHPHRSCYKCSVCGNVWAEDGTSNYYSSCQECIADNVPVLTCDEIAGVENGVFIRGWAFDPDTPGESLEIHIYIDGIYAGYCVADFSRPDVHNVYGCGEYHGFEATIPYSVSATDTHYVEVFALNTTYGKDATGRGPFSVTITKHSHSYRSNVTTEPTCGSTGVRTYYCSGCSDSYTETISATGNHEYGDWILTDNGGTLIYIKYCSNCSDYMTTHGNSVTYVYGNGEPAQTVAVEPGEYYTIPMDAIPEQFGYDFYGWETNDGTIFQPGDTIPYCGNVILSAYWSKRYVRLNNYDQLSYVMRYPGVGTSFALLIYESGNYRFKGLNDSDLDTVAYIYDLDGNLICYDDDSAGNRQFLIQQYLEAGSYVVEIGPYYSSVGTLEWEIAQTFPVTYVDPYTDIILAQNDCYSCDSLGNEYIVTIPSEIPVKDGYRFLGWRLNLDATNATYHPSETVILDYSGKDFDVITSSPAIIGDAYLYAVWERTAIGGTCGDNLTWTLDEEGTLTISGTGPMYDFKFEETPWYSYNDSIKELVIADGVTTIGNYAFEECSSLTSVTIGSGVTTIGDYAFDYCSSLTSVVIPDSVTTIGDAAFWYCRNLTDLTIGNSVTTIGSHAFIYCISLTSVTIPDGVTSIGDYAFSDCTNLTTVTIPDSITTIGECMFYGCISLTSVTIPDGVTTIGDYAFCCTNLTTVTIPDSVTTIGDDAFWGCASLTSVTIPDSVTAIGKGAFEYCDSLTDLYITDANTWCKISFGDNHANPARYAEKVHILDASGNEVTDVVLDRTVTEIPVFAFNNCTNLTSVTIPDSVTSIGMGAFSRCDSLTSVTIPDSVTTIYGEAFRDCSGLTSVTIPDSVTTIGGCTFMGCIGLTSVTIPSSVTTIGDYAFLDCYSLADVYYMGTEAQWEQIEIGYRIGLTNDEIHFVQIPENGWLELDGKWYYYANGTKVTGWLQLGSVKYYFDESGVMATGECTIEGVVHKFTNGGKWLGEKKPAKTGWVQDGADWYYYENGVKKTGWLDLNGVKYYLDATGTMVTGEYTIAGKVHRFAASGKWLGEKQTKNGWAQESGVWYYYQNGVKKTGWVEVSSKWYYLDANGVMQTGWLQLGNTKYYLRGSGAMVTGQFTIEGVVHKFSSGGKWLGEVQKPAKTGWAQESGVWYYYQNGTKVTGWLELSGTKYYLDETGAMVTGEYTIEDVVYKFSAGGKLLGVVQSTQISA